MMKRDRMVVEEHDVVLLEELMAGEILLPTQGVSPCAWSPEKRLAGTVLRDALLEVRQVRRDPHSQAPIVEDLAWIYDDDSDWPFSFLRLCAVFGLDPAWVRERVEAWRSNSRTLRVVSGPARVTPPVPHAA
jgi:hypothetical protein